MKCEHVCTQWMPSSAEMLKKMSHDQKRKKKQWKKSLPKNERKTPNRIESKMNGVFYVVFFNAPDIRSISYLWHRIIIKILF